MIRVDPGVHGILLVLAGSDLVVRIEPVSVAIQRIAACNTFRKQSLVYVDEDSSLLLRHTEMRCKGDGNYSRTGTCTAITNTAVGHGCCDAGPGTDVGVAQSCFPSRRHPRGFETHGLCSSEGRWTFLQKTGSLGA